ncbi:MAG: hypothetical protein ACRDJW_07620 [Thermomicrobiales bacterium]
MTPPTILDRFTSDLYSLLDETFRNVHGQYLDKQTSLFETLATISAEEASRPVGGRCATLAAQVNHVRFYIDVMERYMRGEEVGEVDWDASWQIAAVDDVEWESLKRRLDAAYESVLATMHGFTTWDGEEQILDAMAILVHTAYHLGEIRQALCTIKQ